jgi:membrane protease YdiL (CAAX protease family)
MTAYEILFRGILLFGTLPLLGAPAAILLNMSLYSLTHIPKGLKETLGALPVGFLFCAITLYTGTIWIALLVHGMLAVANDLFALYFHSEMGYSASEKRAG